MSLVGAPCERCGKEVFTARYANGREGEFESAEGAVRLDGGRAVPMVNIYLPHDVRCPGEICESDA